MSGPAKILLGAAALAVVVALYLVLRPDGTRDEPAELAPAPPAETSTEEAETEAETATEEEPSGPQVIRLDVQAGEGDIERAEVEQGRRVVLVVRADVADHVHLHGYDLMSDVAPGQPARISFRADVPGAFEIELEDRGQHIGQLTVTP